MINRDPTQSPRTRTDIKLIDYVSLVAIGMLLLVGGDNRFTQVMGGAFLLLAAAFFLNYHRWWSTKIQRVLSPLWRKTKRRPS